MDDPKQLQKFAIVNAIASCCNEETPLHIDKIAESAQLQLVLYNLTDASEALGKDKQAWFKAAEDADYILSQEEPGYYTRN